MIHKIGVLPAGNHRQVPVAFQLFSQESEYGWKMGQEFKHNFCNDVQIEFLGVWYALLWDMYRLSDTYFSFPDPGIPLRRL